LLLGGGVERYGHRIHAMCCMSNHIHLAVQVGNVPLSKIMQNLSFRYTRWINKQQQRVGHLFQGRYNAILVDEEAYLLELVRYIHLTPVRANLVKAAVEYPWSGHQAYLGKETLQWLETDWLLSQFGKRLTTCRKRYAAFVAEGLDDGYREAFHQGSNDPRVLGDDSYIEKVTQAKRCLQPSVTLKEITGVVSKAYGVSQSELKSLSRVRCVCETRAVISWLATEQGMANLERLANFFHRDATTLSKAVNAIARRQRTSREFKRKINALGNAIMQV